jgi:2-methylisocitrate lyase-like PEP mutase family enzyme
VTALAQGPLPLNIMVWPGAPSVAELAACGVARISLGGAIAEAAYGLADRAARSCSPPAPTTAPPAGSPTPP